MGASFDVIVVGARVAGSPAAMLLARKGYRVLLMDRAPFPSDTLSTHMIHESGVAQLARWGGGLLERLVATGCPPLTRSRMQSPLGVYFSEHLPVDGISTGFCPRRTVLDALLLDAAAQSGAEVRTRFEVQSLLFDEEGRVIGLRGRDAEGRTVEERARLVVGADGKHSFVARQVEAAKYDVLPTTTCTYYAYWSGVSRGYTELYPGVGNMFVCVPTHDDLCVLTAIWPRSEFARVKASPEESYLDALAAAVPELHERVRAGKRAERYKGTADLPFFYRRSHGPGWALVGDAGFNKDPLLAQGIGDAFRDAELLADAVDAGLSGSAPLDTALERYEQKRHQLSRDVYLYTYELSLLRPPSPEQRRLFALCQRDPAEASRAHGVISGAVSYQEYFGHPAPWPEPEASAGSFGSLPA